MVLYAVLSVATLSYDLSVRRSEIFSVWAGAACCHPKLKFGPKLVALNEKFYNFKEISFN